MNLAKYIKNHYPKSLTIIETLQKHNFEAYVVGGAIRDWLIGLEPKDIDIATSATPKQVKKIFGHKAVIIGRRFLIVHIRFGRDIYEISTFRRIPSDEESKKTILLPHRFQEDNLWGNLTQDAQRRDFNINSLYYEPFQEKIIDPLGIQDDFNQKIIFSIGNPERRFKEDPVRMLRAIKFAAQTGFILEEDIKKTIIKNYYLLCKIPQRRLFEELLKLTYKNFLHEFFILSFELKLNSSFLPKFETLSIKEQEFTLIALKNRFNSIDKKLPSRNYTLAILWYPYVRRILSRNNSLMKKGWNIKEGTFYVLDNILCSFYKPYIIPKSRKERIVAIIYVTNALLNEKKYKNKYIVPSDIYYANKVYQIILDTTDNEEV